MTGQDCDSDCVPDYLPAKDGTEQAAVPLGHVMIVVEDLMPGV